MASSTVRLRLFLEPVIDVVGAVVRQVVHDDVPIPNGIANVDDTLGDRGEGVYLWGALAHLAQRSAQTTEASTCGYRVARRGATIEWAVDRVVRLQHDGSQLGGVKLFALCKMLRRRPGQHVTSTA